MPLFFLTLWFSGLLSLILFGSGLYVFWQIYTQSLQGIVYILLAGFLLIASFFGKYLVLLFFPSSSTFLKKKATPIQEEDIPGEEHARLHLSYFNRDKDNALILTHGWGLSSSEWQPLMHDLTNLSNVITWDLPGLGKSTQPQSSHISIPSFAKDLKRIIDHIPEKKVTLVGHSIGGMIILTFCRLFPDYLTTHVEKITIVNSTYTKPTRTVLFHTLIQKLEHTLITPLCYITIVLSPLVRVMNCINYQSGFLHIMTVLTGFAGNESREALDFATKFAIHTNPAIFARGIRAMLSFDETRTLNTIPVPTQIISASADKVTLPQASVVMDKNILHAQLVTVEAGHMSVIEQYQKVLHLISSFSACSPNT